MSAMRQSNTIEESSLTPSIVMYYLMMMVIIIEFMHAGYFNGRCLHDHAEGSGYASVGPLPTFHQWVLAESFVLASYSMLSFLVVLAYQKRSLVVAL